MADDVLLEARELVAGYLPGVDILHGASLELRRGRLVGIIGPNGAGKSTLIKALFGLVPVRSGEVLLDGKDITRLKAHELVARGGGYVPQVRNVFGTLTIEENLKMGAFLEPSRYDERFGVVAELFPLLSERRRDKVSNLSGGHSPMNQDEVFGRIDQVKAAGVSVVMVEQNARKFLQIADTAFVLDQGRTAYEGSGSSLLEDPTVIELYLGTLARNV